MGRGGLIKYHITGWHRHNTVLNYNCPCQKDTGFFFIPIAAASELIGSGKASEMDAILDLWFSAIYKDDRVLGSDIGPVIYLRNGTGNPLLSYTDLSRRWGISHSSVGRLLKKLSDKQYLTLMSFPGRTGSVIYLNNYLSTMFQISDVVVDKEEVAMSLNIRLCIPDEPVKAFKASPSAPEISVPKEPLCVPKQQAAIIVEKVAQILAVQGIACFKCPHVTYRLYPLSPDCGKADHQIDDPSPRIRLGLTVHCASDCPVYRMELTLTPLPQKSQEGVDQDGKED